MVCLATREMAAVFLPKCQIHHYIMKKENLNPANPELATQENVAISPERIIDQELFGLLKSLQETKSVHRNICARMRKNGVELSNGIEDRFDENINDIITFASCLTAEQLDHDIKKGGTE